MQGSNQSKNFKDILWKLMEKEAHIIKTQKFRLREILVLHWNSYDFGLPEIKDFLPNKTSFYTKLSSRVEILKDLNEAFVQILNILIRITEILLIYYPDSEDFNNSFSFENNRVIAYKMTEDLLGSVLPLLNYLQNPIYVDMLIVGLYKSRLKVTGMTAEEIQSNLKSYNLQISSEAVIEIMNNLVETSKWIRFERKISPDNSIIWMISAEEPLSDEISKHYSKHILPLINWVVSTWRSLYNIRELYVPIPDNISHADMLRKAIAAAAQQGFTAASNVVQNLANYYQFLLDQAKK